MSLTKLRCLASAVGLTSKNVLISRLSTRGTSAALLTCRRAKATVTKGRSNDDDDDNINTPIKFSDSAAARWDAVDSRVGTSEDDRPWFQTYVIVASVAVFLIYFCVLREENDIDQKLSRDLSDHFNEEQARNLKISQELSIQLAQEARFRNAEKK